MAVKKTYKIALLTDTDAEEFTHELVRGLIDEVSFQKQILGQHFQIILVDGKNLVDPDDPKYEFNKIFELIKPEYFDGILAHTGMLGLTARTERLNEFCKLVSSLPTIFMGWSPEDSYGVQLENTQAMHELMTHLSQAHHYKNFMFLGGPEEHRESRIREKGFKAFLAENDLPLMEKNIIYGDFSIQAGERAVEEMIKQDSTLRQWDCLVCANDNMAYGAIMQLQKMDYRIPEDIAVTGFDNADYCLSVYPSITTMGNPIYEMTRRSFELLVELLNNKGIEKNHWVPSTLILRESCGCPHRESSIRFKAHNEVTPELFTEDMIILDNLISILVEDKNPDNISRFFNEFNRYLSRKQQDSNIPFHERIIQYVAEKILHLHELDTHRKEKYLNYFQQEIQRARIRQERNHFIEYRKINYHLDMLQEDFRNSKIDMNIHDVLSENMVNLQIPSLYLGLYNDQESLIQPYLLYRNGKSEDLSHLESYKPEQILPPIDFSESESNIGIFSPLIFMRRKIGFAFFETSIHRLHAIPSLARQLSSISTHLYNAIELKNKNKHLEESLSQLKLTQKSLLQAEKMASLGVMVSGIAHEINGPIGVSISLSSHLKDTLQEMKQLNPQTSLSEMKKEWDKLYKGIDLLFTNLTKAGELVQNYKMVATDQTSEQKRKFEIYSYIKAVMKSQQSEMKNRQISYTVRGCETLIVDSYPGFVSQVITQLVKNSLFHGFAQEEKGEIDISLAEEGEMLQIHYHDTGKGIPKEIESKIFDPFFTTANKIGKSGLGLHIVYNIINNRLDGLIELEETEKGTAFLISLPIIKKTSP